MEREGNAPRSAKHVTTLVRRRIEVGGERLWRLRDFNDLPVSAVAQALSRLAQQGKLDRLSKGVYYSARETGLRKKQAKSSPDPGTWPQKTAPSSRPALRRRTFSVSRLKMRLAARSPPAPSACRANWSAPIPSFTRAARRRRPRCSPKRTPPFSTSFADPARPASLGNAETVRLLVALLSEKGRFDRLLKVADTEPPRVRAMLGAIGKTLSPGAPALRHLRASLNPLSRFDFGLLSSLPRARQWQAKDYLVKLFEHTDFDQAILRAAEHFKARGSVPP